MDWKKLVASVLICQMTGLIGALFTTPAIATWYVGITKPSFNPPNWIFGPVWTILYLLMGLSLYLVWSQGFEKNKMRMGVFGAQLGLNVVWSVLFFGMGNFGAAFVEILALWVAIAATIVVFYKTSKKASLMLVPYICWVSFAALLNFAIWRLNP